MQRLTRMRRRKTMMSAVTGKLTAYELVRSMDTCDRFTADMQQVKTSLQDELFAQGHDVFVEQCAQIRETSYDYLLTDLWFPAESPIPPVIVAAVGIFLKYVLPVIILGLTFVVVNKAFHDIWMPPQRFWCDICGAEFPSVTALTAHRRTAHPETPAYQCPYCGSSFQTAEELAKHMSECPLKPTPPSDWLMWVAIISVTVVGGYFVLKTTKMI